MGWRLTNQVIVCGSGWQLALVAVVLLASDGVGCVGWSGFVYSLKVVVLKWRRVLKGGQTKLTIVLL